LRKKLEEAISGEDYEAAARLRDEIKKMEGA
jgi:protein-arginine kinase activator protein McsA